MKKSQSLKVGGFVAFGIVLAVISVFLIGEGRHMWDSKASYHATFTEVAGLKPGAPVRMGGVDIGNVKAVGHSGDPADPKIHVTFQVVRSEAIRIRAGKYKANGEPVEEPARGPDGSILKNEDGSPKMMKMVGTIAQVSNKGLLGDKMIELSIDGKGDPLPNEGVLKSEDPVDFGKYISKLDDISKKAQVIVNNIEVGTRPLADPKFSEDLKSSLSSLRNILDGVSKEDSAAHRLLLDPKEGPKVSAILSNMQGVSGDVHEMTTKVKEGPGLAHAVLFDSELSSHASGTLAEIHKDLTAIREGNGIVHALVYGDNETQHIMGNVNAMSDDLRAIINGVKNGKGTIGALLVDPSVYEDIKSVVGNVERNQVLRALVRYSIHADESKPAAKVQAASR